MRPADTATISILETIPFRDAGSPVPALPTAMAAEARLKKEGERVALNGAEYRVFNDYLVPYYAISEHALSRRSEQLVLDRVKRFFYSAEQELDIPWTRADIEAEITAYGQCGDAELKAVKGRFLVGALVNRMGRLAQAILQGNIDGIDIEMTHEDGEYKLTDAQLAMCRAEFRNDYIFLIADEEKSPVHYVRRQDGSPDHDGILLDLVREMGKPLLMNATNETFLYRGLLQKISYAMAAIDEVHALMQGIVDVPHVSAAMEVMTRPHAASYRDLLAELTDLCRARAGLRAQDRANFGPVRERIDYVAARLSDIHQRLDGQSHIRGYVELHKIQTLLKEGVALMRDMATTRYPRNHRSQEAGGASDASSVGRFAAAIAQWRSLAASE